MNPEPKVPQVQDGGRGGQESQHVEGGVPTSQGDRVHRGWTPAALTLSLGCLQARAQGTDEHSASQGEEGPRRPCLHLKGNLWGRRGPRYAQLHLMGDRETG